VVVVVVDQRSPHQMQRKQRCSLGCFEFHSLPPTNVWALPAAEANQAHAQCTDNLLLTRKRLGCLWWAIAFLQTSAASALGWGGGGIVVKVPVQCYWPSTPPIIHFEVAATQTFADSPTVLGAIVIR
jgi:hypothetical protein